ncbi:MAG: hypothetical protein O3C10_12090, partial [Chloroflexi bacterium]|nr:hypothetical protein [Chloroflexota bacterium]
GDRVEIHPNVTGQNVDYEGRIGVVLHIEADTLHHHLGGIAQYRVRLVGEDPMVTISLSERELTRARRGDHEAAGPG